MKIAIPVNNNSMESGVCESFGRAEYFLIYDTKTKENAFLDNAAAASKGGAGIVAAQALVDSEIDALLTSRCGENAAEVLNAANIKIYKTVDDSINNNIKAFNDEKLSLLKDMHSGFHHHGGN